MDLRLNPETFKKLREKANNNGESIAVLINRILNESILNEKEKTNEQRPKD